MWFGGFEEGGDLEGQTSPHTWSPKKKGGGGGGGIEVGGET